jgi:hypothetical protein
MTTKFTFSSITLADLKRLVNLKEGRIANYPWTQVETLPLTAIEQSYLQFVQAGLLHCDTHLMNEATIWARGIYPLLRLAEQDDIQACAGVPLAAQYPQFELDGVADGVLGKVVAGRVESPYLVVVETKRGVEGQNPVFQLYAQLLAAAHLNWEANQMTIQEIFGCYTIADSWKFMRAEVEGIDTELPTLRIEGSREYTEKMEIDTIFKILRNIVSKHVNAAT